MNPLLPCAELCGESVLRGSKSSFRPAFFFLSRARRHDLATLYAFCRKADDIADAGDYPPEMRREALEAWRKAFRPEGGASLPRELQELIARRKLPQKFFLELLDGVETDLEKPVRMATRAALDLYCHRVAGAVGLLCLPVFGADPDRAAPYAEALGRALQHTNILRDTASDLRRGRIYYPLDELRSAGLDEEGFLAPSEARQTYLENFAARADQEFRCAAALSPASDRRALRPARVMAAVYAALLAKMRREGIPVSEKRMRLTGAEKVRAVAGALFS